MNASKNKLHPVAVEEGLLDEYRTLRGEIQGAQSQRMQIISLTTGAYGVLLSLSGGLVLGSQNITAKDQLLISIGGAVTLYAILIPSLIMMLSVQ